MVSDPQQCERFYHGRVWEPLKFSERSRIRHGGPPVSPHSTCADGPAFGGPCQATPREELLHQLLDSRVPKNEREWCAAREIERLREGIEEALMHLDTNYCIDEHSMRDSDAAAALRRVWPNAP